MTAGGFSVRSTGTAAIRAQGGDSADVTGAILIAGLILAAVGVIVHFGGSHYVRAVLPPAVTGAVVMLIGFNLASVATTMAASPWCCTE
jgi:xanthine/uracil permease